jgi:ribosomal protein L40E
MPKKAMGPVFGRLFQNVFICLRCNGKIRAQPDKVKRGLIKCRKCGSYKLRPKAKEPRGAKTTAAAK